MSARPDQRPAAQAGEDAAPGTTAAPAWVRATLDLAVLAVLGEGDRHGYALAQRLDHHGLGPVRGGALYPVLGRLEGDGAVRSSWSPGEGGPGRKVYSITDDGRRRLAADEERWRRFAGTLQRVLDGSARPGPGGT